ncbi:chemotaxis protein MotB [Tepidicella xavieri]|uniref:Chemotaxis protein MotB n=2 Tax=Tepidicella xavieri TaxID=360241 RepID=A0A4R6UGH0_9BURK|nr:chemotaxis protein MotB [Tepidicella xavieri]
MSGGTLLEKMWGEMQASSQSTSAATSASDSGPNRAISALRSGRFERWHTDPVPPQEDESWLVTYLDVVTLLLAMMVVMLAFSEPISESFRGEKRESALDRQSPIVQSAADAGTSIVPPIPLPHPATAPARVEGEPQDMRPAPPRPAVEVGDLGQGIEVTTGQGVVRFRISSEVLFASGDASLTPEGQAVIDRLLPAFNQAPDHTIVVEGHSDNVPINTPRFPSNWELSASRAGAVVRHLEARGINPTRLRASGLADTRPVADNATPEGRSQNRRVEIVMEAPDPQR